MKIENLFLTATGAIALTLIILLNQNKASAQSSGHSHECPTTSVPNNDSKVDKVSLETCGSCTVITIRSGWTPSQGLGSKYEVTVVPYEGTSVTCKSAINQTCVEVVVSEIGSCTPPPDDYGQITGSGSTSTTTGT